MDTALRDIEFCDDAQDSDDVIGQECSVLIDIREQQCRSRNLCCLILREMPREERPAGKAEKEASGEKGGIRADGQTRRGAASGNQGRGHAWPKTGKPRPGRNGTGRRAGKSGIRATGNAERTGKSGNSTL